MLKRAYEIGYKDAELSIEENKKVTSFTEQLKLPRLNEATLEQYIQAGNIGNVKAQLELAYWYEDDDDDEYISWLEKAAEQGNSMAQFKLGYYYEDNFYKNKSYDELSCKWYTKAAENGHNEAQFKLGEYYSGKDDEKSIEWYAKAAEQGNFEAEFELRKWNLYDYFSLIGKI